MKPRVSTLNHTLLAYATPIRQTRYPNLDDFNRELTARILHLRQQSPAGEKRSNIGGWHSDNKLLQKLGEPYAARLGSMFMENVRAALDTIAEPSEPLPTNITLEAWANISNHGDSNTPHIHGGCPWSGVYYVTAGDTNAAASGTLAFTDPRTAALMVVHPYNPFKGSNRITLIPEPGMMIVFPSFLYHSVDPYLGQSPRISIAFNLL
jgi:uncharacterized protein (TIGR02466 family)